MKTRAEKRNRKRYNQASSDNDILMSNGGGIDPYPAFHEWMELGGYVIPAWRHELEEKRKQKVSSPVVGDLVSDIVAEIAAEEHRQGLPYSPDPEHCHGCADEAKRQKQAACPHDDPVEYTVESLDGRVVVHHAYCGACGAGQPDWDFKMTRILG